MDDSPYSSPPSSHVPPPAPGGPNANPTPKTLGVLNIIFGSLLLAFGCLCYGPGMLFFFLGMPALLDTSKNALKQVQRAQQEQIDRLQAELDTAEDEQQKINLQAQIDALKQQIGQLAQNPALSMDTDKFKELAQNRIVTGYYLVNVVSGMLLNLLMLMSGAKLTKYKAAGYSLAMKVYLLKIVRLVLLLAVSILFVMPASLEMNKAFIESQPNNPMAQFGGQSLASGIVSAVVMVVLGSIYPIVAMLILSRPHNKAACNRP